MATVCIARTTWEGNLQDGHGSVALASSALDSFRVGWPTRTNGLDGLGETSPEELIAAAHSSCFSMALSHGLTQAGTPPQRLKTQAEVTFEPGQGITRIHLSVRGAGAGLGAEEFARAAEDARANCPVSQALSGIPITLAVIPG